MVRVLDGFDVEPRPFRDHATLRLRNESPAYDLGHLFQQHRLCRAGVNAPAPCGEADGHAGLDVSGLDDHRGAGEDDLRGPLNLDPSAPARAPVSAHDATNRFLDVPGQEVLEGDPAYRVCEQVPVERVLSGTDSDQGRRGEGISLHPVYEEHKRTEVVRAGEFLVSPVPLTVYAVKRRT